MTNEGTASTTELWDTIEVALRSSRWPEWDKAMDALDSLRTRMAELEQELEERPTRSHIEDLQRQDVANTALVLKLSRQLAQVEQERDEARGLLRVFGQHGRSCDRTDPLLISARLVGLDVKCSCGFSTALAALDQEENGSASKGGD